LGGGVVQRPGHRARVDHVRAALERQVPRLRELRETDRITASSFLTFTPAPHQGKAEIVPLRELEIADEDGNGTRTMLWTVFQRQRFEVRVLERDEKDGRGKTKAEVIEVATPVD
jgi:hypothetical protein